MKTWVELSQVNATHNVNQIRSLLEEGVVFCAVLKANAYGHGIEEMFLLYKQCGVTVFAVDSLSEAEVLRKLDQHCTILILGFTPVEEYEVVIRGKYIQTMYDTESLLVLQEIATKKGNNAFISIKCETGTQRQGVGESDLNHMLSTLKNTPNIQLISLHSHFANAEHPEAPQMTELQSSRFANMAHDVFVRGFKPEFVHIACSAAAITDPETQFNMVRIGIAGYGLWSSPEVKKFNQISKQPIDLKPVLSWKTVIAQVKQVSKGSPIGYGCSYIPDRDKRIAIIPIGYYDGYSRSYAKDGYVLIHGKQAKILGIICMNMFMVDVSDIVSAHAGQEVTLIGRSGMHEIQASTLAGWANTIHYEVVTNIKPHIKRRIK